MAKNFTLAADTANAAADAMAALCDGGFLDIYDGAQPASPDTAITTQVLLASAQFDSPAFGAAAAGIATANAITGTTDADAGGTAAWFRIFAADHVTPVFDGSVGTSAADLILASTTISEHQAVPIVSFTLTVPEP